MLEPPKTNKFTMKWTFYSLITVTFFVVLMSVTQVGPFSAMRKSISTKDELNYVTDVHAIIFDAGSTGTRIHIFTFLNNSEGHLVLADEYYQEVKPGLSSYFDKPHKAAKSITGMLEKAKSVIPDHRHSKTPVVLKATAGLRLLSSHSANAILEQVNNTIRKTPFDVPENAVSIMDGEDEGLFAWFTVNFLLGLLADPGNSVVTLDLGGGSTQITFAPVDTETLIYSPKDYIIQKVIQKIPYTLYTHSYLGQGLMAARRAILTPAHNESQEELQVLQGACISPQTKKVWTYGGTDYLVTGLKSGTYNYEACYAKAVSFLNNTIDRPVEILQRKIYGLSYYYDRAADLKLIDYKSGGVVTLEQYIDAAKAACQIHNSEKPFLCLDSTYITALLHYGLNLNKNKEIVLVTKIDGIETSWGLGAAFSVLR